MENIEIIDRQETVYTGLYLGCAIKSKKSDETQKYGVISLYFNGVNQKGENWYSVQEQYTSVENLQELTKDIPFGSKVKATYSCGNTPGGKQKLYKLQLQED